MQAQAPICPFCFDDHSSLDSCDVRELKKRVVSDRIQSVRQEIFNHTYVDGGGQFLTTVGVELAEIKRLVEWL
jgi:hypothetical protein